MNQNSRKIQTQLTNIGIRGEGEVKPARYQHAQPVKHPADIWDNPLEAQPTQPRPVRSGDGAKQTVNTFWGKYRKIETWLEIIVATCNEQQKDNLKQDLIVI